MSKLKVIGWNTGKVGVNALRAILDDPRLELVGLFAWSKDKVGQDAGTIADRPATGVIATADVDALAALRADTVIYTPYKADLDHILKMLESGADVISTNLLQNLGGVQGEVREKIEAACAKGNSSLYITGINPGWLDTVAATITTVCRKVESVSVLESVGVSHYESIPTWTAVGMGMRSATPEVLESARSSLISFRDSVQRVADAMAFELDDIVFVVDYATAAKDLDFGWWQIEKGAHAALKAGWEGKIKGKTVIRNQVIWYMTKELNENWEVDKNNYLIDVVGEPGIELRMRIEIPRHWGNRDHGIVTALPAVSAAHQVKAAPAGILGLSGAGLPVAPAGVWYGR